MNRVKAKDGLDSGDHSVKPTRTVHPRVVARLASMDRSRCNYRSLARSGQQCDCYECEPDAYHNTGGLWAWYECDCVTCMDLRCQDVDQHKHEEEAAYDKVE
jgi:hypothetical protein